MATIDFRAAIRAEYNVSDSQLDACDRYERGNGQVFYTVASASVDLCYYRVEFNAERGGLQCLPHSGQVCKASQNGVCCWHKRAACASDRIFKYNLAQQRRREAEAVEREATYREEHAQVDLDAAALNLAAAKREQAAVKRSTRAYERPAFSLLK